MNFSGFRKNESILSRQHRYYLELVGGALYFLAQGNIFAAFCKSSTAPQEFLLEVPLYCPSS